MFKKIFFKHVLGFFLIFFLASCVSKQIETVAPTSNTGRGQLESKNTKLKSAADPMAESQAMLGDLTKDWFYGPGLGSTMLQAGTTLAFPPYGIYLLGNLALSLSGYEPLGFSSVMSDSGKQEWLKAYDSFVSGPGLVTSAIAGEKFRTGAETKERMKKLLEEHYAKRQDKR